MTLQKSSGTPSNFSATYFVTINLDYFVLSCLFLFPSILVILSSLGEAKAFINYLSPERRCSSRTFRYGYLVTT